MDSYLGSSDRQSTAVLERPRHDSGVSLMAELSPSTLDLKMAHRRLHRKAIVIGILAAASYVQLVMVPTSVMIKVIAAAVLTISLIAAATSVFHDGNHASFAASRLANRCAGYTGDLMGASSWIWRFKHNNLHHGNTNVEGSDTDIEQAPFARLSPAQTWRPWHRYQHIYMWILYGFLTLQWFLISDFIDLWARGIGGHHFPRRPRRRDVATIFAGKGIHFGWALVVPFMFHSWWMVVTFYVAISWTVGLALSTMFQLAHCNELAEFPPADAPRRGNDFVEHQLRTTVDVHCRTLVGARMLHWLMGGLDFQIEHHLAPRLPHTIYPAVAARLKVACAERNLLLRSHVTPWHAIRSHGRWLKLMGVRPGSRSRMVS